MWDVECIFSSARLVQASVTSAYSESTLTHCYEVATCKQQAGVGKASRTFALPRASRHSYLAKRGGEKLNASTVLPSICLFRFLSIIPIYWCNLLVSL